MSGRLNEKCYKTVKRDYESDQQKLASFGGTDETLISVVRKPNGSKIDVYCDEHRPELGMPARPLKTFHELRAGYYGNSAVDDAHNTAFDDANLDAIYRDYIDSGEARQSVREIVQRLRTGENITLVCFEEEGERCHRRILMDTIESERQSSESKFVFVRNKRKSRE